MFRIRNLRSTGTLARWRPPFPIQHRDGTGRVWHGDGVDLLDTADHDGNYGGLSWGRHGDGGGLHAHPHTPIFFFKKRRNIKKRKEESTESRLSLAWTSGT